MRLIDADALREVLETTVRITPITQQYQKEDVIRAIMDAPTIAHGTNSVVIQWAPDIDELARDVAFRALKEYSYLGKSIEEWAEIIPEQEPVAPKQPVSAEDPFVLCGHCGLPIASDMYKYCPWCGRKVKWNEQD